VDQRQRNPSSKKKRRTTLILPNESLLQAERIARDRKVNLSIVISEALAEGLRLDSAAERSKQMLTAYRNPFAEFSDDEMAVLDGIILEPISKK
jgi:hypothetical protein